MRGLRVVRWKRLPELCALVPGRRSPQGSSCVSASFQHRAPPASTMPKDVDAHPLPWTKDTMDEDGWVLCDAEGRPPCTPPSCAKPSYVKASVYEVDLSSD